MKLHEIKIEYKYALEWISDKKTFEIRYNDRDYKVGDLVKFQVVSIPQEDKQKYTYALNYFQDTIFQISYIFYGDDYGLYGIYKDYCVFSLKKIGEVGRK